MKKKYVIEIESEEDFDQTDVTGLFYLGRTSDATPAEIAKMSVTLVSEVPQVTNGRMTFEQREKLWEVCGRYGVPFREDDYTRPSEISGMVEGWIGGDRARIADQGRGDSSVRRTVYMGVEPNGASHT